MTKQELIERADSLGIEVDKRWGLEKLKAAIADNMPEVDQSECVESVDHDLIAQMNAYAKRVAAGQSPDSTPQWKRERIESALKDQGFGDLLEYLVI